MTRLFVMLGLVCVGPGFVFANVDDNVLRTYFQTGQWIGNVTTFQAAQ